MSSRNRTATTAGVLFLITEVTAIAGLLLYGPVLSDPAGYIAGTGSDNRILLGAFCELLLVLAVVGTASTLYPVIRRYNEGMALAHVGFRFLEAAVIAVGAVATIAVVTLRQDGPAGAADEAGLAAVSQGLVALHDWTFAFGPWFLLGVNTFLLAYLVRRGRLVHRFIPVLGMIGAVLVFGSGVNVMFGVYGHETHMLFAVPVFSWEVSFALYMIIKGFKTSPSTTGPDTRPESSVGSLAGAVA